ncbi:restriction endonuclease [Ensifer canadensis]
MQKKAIVGARRRAEIKDPVSRIRELDRRQLGRLWKRIEANDTADWPQGKAFELAVLRAFELEGAKVVWPYHARIQNTIVEEIDGFVQTSGISFMVESKDLGDAVGIGPIAKLRNQLARRPAGLLGCVFSRSGFTPPAVLLSTYCAPQAILLWTGDEIAEALPAREMTAALVDKYNVLLRLGVPDWEFTRRKGS